MKIAPYAPGDLDDVTALFRAYSKSIGVDLGYQDFGAELAGLPGKYAPPTGALLIARDGDAAVGCVALRKSADGICEMKRLYVAPAARGTCLGRRLAEAIIAQGRALGYGEIRLDTLPTMLDAIGLYHALGFESTAPYYNTPITGTVFLALRLKD